jgi:leucyl aminopeptidase
MKLTTTSKDITSLPKEITHVVFTQTSSSRFVEQKNGTLLFEFGIGKEAYTLRTLRIMVRKLMEEIKRYGWKCISLPGVKECALGVNIDEDQLGETYAYNLFLAQYTFSKYKSKNTEHRLAEVLFRTTTSKDFSEGLRRGGIIAEATNIARDIANTPGGDMTPRVLANNAQKVLKGTNVKVTVLGKKEIEKLKMGAILGVAKGSTEEPRFIVMEYKGGKKNEAPIVFVGKGITFDTGGLSMKPADAMLDMHLDMTGGATVIGAMRAIAKLGIKRNVIGLIPSAENMVSGESYRPGDVLTTMSGKTVDVLNTDAEGRLVLADALTYAERYNPKLVIDVATLTGAALVALGQHASAIMTKDDKLAETLSRFGEESGDYVWRLPLWNEYIKYTKGVHGDLANIQSSGNARYGGAINGGAFLSHFAGKYLWAHIDMAPRMTPAPGDYLAKGCTGEPTALLVKIAEKY